MKKILIICGTGSIGYYLTNHLIDCGFKVAITGSRNRSTEFFTQRGINYYQVDIRKLEELKAINENFDTVIHLAGLMPARMEGYYPQKYFEVNTIGTLNVLEFCRERSVNQVIYALSHSDVAGYWNIEGQIPEDSVKSPNLRGDHAVYIISKMAAADLTTHYFLEYGIRNIILRFPTIYCYWPEHTMYVNGKKTVIPYLYLIEKALSGETIEIWGDPKKSKDIVYVKDLSYLIESIILNTTSHGTYNVGTASPITLEEQILKIIDIFSQDQNKSKVIYRPEKNSQIQYSYSIDKSMKDFGFSPKYTYDKMLLDMKEEMKVTLLSNFIKCM